MAIVLSLSTPDMGGSVASLTFEDLKIYMPKGLTATASAGEYDRATGLLSIVASISAKSYDVVKSIVAGSSPPVVTTVSVPERTSILPP